MKESSKGCRHFVAAFRYSLSGLRYAFRESAVRQELLLGVVSVVALCFLDLPLPLKLWLVSMWGLVLVVELLNTAIEAVVDLVSPQFNELAKKAKDLGSAAVFCTLLLYVVAWGMGIVYML